MEDLEKQFIESCESTLLKEGKEICEEVLVMIGEQDKMEMEKAEIFCNYFLRHKPDGVETTELEKRCMKYKEDFCNYFNHKRLFKNNRREIDEILKNNMRLKKI